MAAKKTNTEVNEQEKVVVEAEAKVEDLGPAENVNAEAPKAEAPKKGFFAKVGDGLKKAKDGVVSFTKKHPYVTGAIVGSAAVAGGVLAYNKIQESKAEDTTADTETPLLDDPELSYLEEYEADLEAPELETVEVTEL